MGVVGHYTLDVHLSPIPEHFYVNEPISSQESLAINASVNEILLRKKV
jgi:hypothetical protein